MSADANDIQIGTILRGTYEVVSLLGTGGMGRVYLARHLRLPSKQVAVKVLVSAEPLTADQYARFRREAEITSRLTHPNIVGILDFHGMEAESGSPFLVLEHLQGETLSRRMRKGPIPLPEALFIARQVGSALHAAHQTGIIHRDLKPGNVFLVPTESWDVADYQVKLLDFGISKLVSSNTMHTRDDVLLGTPRYMSPEQAKGQNSKVDARSDLFALAVIVHEMIVGKSPFADDTVVGIIYRIVNEEPPPLDTLLPEVPAPVAAAVTRALAKQPEDRQPSIAAFIEELTGTLTPSFAPVSGVRPALAGEVSPSQYTGRSRTGGSARPSVEPSAAPPPPATVPPAVPREPTLVPPLTATPAEMPPAAPRTRSLVLPGALLALLLGAAGAALLWPRPPPPVASAAPAAVAQAPRALAPAPAPAAQPTPSEPAPTQPTPPEPAPAPAPAAVAAPSPSRPTVAPKSAEVLPEQVRKLLEEAEAALEAGNATEAIRLARSSQRTAITGASFALLTRAHCRHGDLTNVRTQWQRVPAALRPAVRQYCLRYDIDL